jgi:hypothetical protein
MHLRPLEKGPFFDHPIEGLPVDEVVITTVDLVGAGGPGRVRDAKAEIRKGLLDPSRERRFPRAARGRQNEQQERIHWPSRTRAIVVMCCGGSRGYGSREAPLLLHLIEDTSVLDVPGPSALREVFELGAHLRVERVFHGHVLLEDGSHLAA